MAFRDQILRCAATGKTFVWTVAEQREQQRRGLPMDPPLYCPEVRAADVRLSGASHDDEGLEDDAGAAAAPAAVAEAPAARGARDAGPREARGGGSPGRNGARGGRSGGRSGRGPRGARAESESAPAQSELRIRHIGTVKWFDAERGFGFVVHEEGGELFLHGSSLLADSVGVLREGTPVEYEVVSTARGRRAVDVVPLA